MTTRASQAPDRTLHAADAARGKRGRGVPAFLAGMLAVLASAPGAAGVSMPDRPLSIGPDVPNNLVLVPSVEFPTIISQANFDHVNGTDVYQANRVYVGYFDSDKCYQYVFNTDESKRHFKPVAVASNRLCAANGRLWSGNFMNWATTQTIDPFRKALTGGYRVVDTPTETWLEKAASYPEWGHSIYFPYKTLGNQLPTLTGVSRPFVMRMRVIGAGSQMYFTRNDTLARPGTNQAATADDRLGNALLPTTTAPTPWMALTPYNPAVHDLSGLNGSVNDPRVYAVSIRVAVCVDSGVVKPEANCKQYSQGWKPEGLIQKHRDKLRYSIFGYLVDHDIKRDGGILRARQKYVGPYSYDLAKGTTNDNANKEWDPHTGVQYANPDPVDAAATNSANGINTVVNSGVINYLNKFGQTTKEKAKQYDPVSELFYAAVRYFKAQDNVPEYSTIPAGKGDAQSDRFPVITDWSVNPIQYSCQRNVAIGIGDVGTWADRNLPGASSQAGEKEPARPGRVSSDTTVNVVTALQTVFDMEGITSYVADGQYTGGLTPTSGNPLPRSNSAFIAGLAYDAHTRDLQPSMPGMQTLSTFWVDVVQEQTVKEREKNQYYLAAKYGGFEVPADFQPYGRKEPLPDAWWTNGDLVGLANQINDKRPRNYFVAFQAQEMMNGLARAFEGALALRRGAASGVGTNGATAEGGALIYLPTFFTDWHGELTAFGLDAVTGGYVPKWTAGAMLPQPNDRKIYANSGGYKAFRDDQLSGADRANLSARGASSADVVNYLRGDRSKEVARGGSLRNRGGALGDFVHSSPVYVGKPGAVAYAAASFPGSKEYEAFARKAATRTATVYIGANDGMLHGFDAATGRELYAFMPAAALAIPAGLANYAAPDYAHRYFVDGELTAADVYIGGAWKTVLIGTMGRGGKGVFALDITDPNDVKFLWERYESSTPALGNNLSKPVVVQVASGVWKVLLGNGPNSSGDRAQLLTIDVATGVAANIDTGAGSDNGLAGVYPWDSDNDGFADAAYAGDLAGNLWKFRNLGATPSAVKLFATGDPKQPITAAPLVGRKPDSTEDWVFFGTGRYLGVGDPGDKTAQAWYGIIDKGTTVAKAQLVQRKIQTETSLKDKDGNNVPVRAMSAATQGDMDGKSGWYIDLVPPTGAAQGERMVSRNLFDGNRLLGATQIPNAADPCNVGGSGWIMEIDPFTGARTSGRVFDANGDGTIDYKDDTPGGNGQQSIPTSGVGTGSGMNAISIIRGQNDNTVVGSDQTGKPVGQGTATADIGVKRLSWREVVRRD